MGGTWLPTVNHQQKADLVELHEVEIPKLIDQHIGKNAEINAEHYIQYHNELETIPDIKYYFYHEYAFQNPNIIL